MTTSYVDINLFIYIHTHTYESSYTHEYIYIYMYTYIQMYKSMFAHGLMMIIDILIIPDTCLIQHVYVSASACMFTLSTASTDAPSSTSTRTVAVYPRQLAHINAVLPLPFICEYSQVITVQRSIALHEREHAHEYIYTCQYMHIYTHTQTSPMCADTLKKKVHS